MRVDAEQVRAAVLVDRQEDQSMDQNRRCAKAVELIEGAAWQSPLFLAVGGERDQTEVLEERIHPIAVSDRRGRCRSVEVFEATPARAWHLATPELASCRAVERQHEQRLSVVSRQEDMRASEDGRGVPGRDCGLPQHVLRRTELRG